MRLTCWGSDANVGKPVLRSPSRDRGGGLDPAKCCRSRNSWGRCPEEAARTIGRWRGGGREFVSSLRILLTSTGGRISPVRVIASADLDRSTRRLLWRRVVLAPWRRLFQDLLPPAEVVVVSTADDQGAAGGFALDRFRARRRAWRRRVWWAVVVVGLLPIAFEILLTLLINKHSGFIYGFGLGAGLATMLILFDSPPARIENWRTGGPEPRARKRPRRRCVLCCAPAGHCSTTSTPGMATSIMFWSDRPGCSCLSQNVWPGWSESTPAGC